MKKIFFILSAFILLFSSCSNRVDFGEQYKKILYIVNSKEGLYYAQHEASAASPGNISIYCTGSELPGEDIHISYKINTEALDEYNQKEYGDKTESYFLKIPDHVITFESNEIVVRKGEEYGCLNFTLNLQQVAPDRLYIIPITITDIPDGYEISKNMHTIFYAINVSNEFAGAYISNYKEDGSAKGNINKNARAVATRQILFPLASNNNSASYDKGYYSVTINSDNTLKLGTYLQSVMHQNMEENSYYDPENKIFYIHYFIEDQYGNPIQIDETISKI